MPQYNHLPLPKAIKIKQLREEGMVSQVRTSTGAVQNLKGHCDFYGLLLDILSCLVVSA